MNGRPVRTFITIIMDLFVVAAIALTRPLVIPFGVAAIKTPYGGGFEVNTALTIAVILLVEWVLSGIRARA